LSKKAPTFREEMICKKFININGISNIAEINNQQVGKGIPEFTPVEIPLSGYLMHEGIRYVSLKQEPPIL